MKNELITQKLSADAVLIHAIPTGSFDAWVKRQDKLIQEWCAVNQFKAKPATFCLLSNKEGRLCTVYLGVENAEDYWSWGVLTKALPEALYKISPEVTAVMQKRIALAWSLGGYQFDRYKKHKSIKAQLYFPDSIDLSETEHLIASYRLARDLINTPAQDLLPEHYQAIVEKIADEFSASCDVISGEQLEKEFPGVHTVGRASLSGPRLVDLTWGEQSHPKITIVGKGVCFDSGGLDIKPAAGMRYMQKDMAGSAIALGLARMVMAEKLPIRLRLILPIVENAISNNAFHPGDIIRMRSGKTVEVGNTDAEGRLILADALALASEENPDYLIDFSTLTGAARVAAGPDLCAYFTNDDHFNAEFLNAADGISETVFRQPLYQPYRKFIDSRVADLCNMSKTPYGGAITAALFLESFVGKNIPWMHFDVMAWNTRNLPGRPEGGEAMGLWATYECIKRLI